MQTCSTCNYESPSNAKFCRQCGAPLFAESDLSGASTRNYGRQEPAPAVAAAVSAPLPPSVADIIGANTARHYQPPQAFVQPVINTAPINTSVSKPRNLRLVAIILLVLFVGLGLGRLFAPSRSFDRTPVPMSPEETIRLDMEAQRHVQQQMMADRIREAQDRAREAQDRVREAQERARELAERAAAEGAVIATGDVKPLDLSQYEYPGANVGNYSRIPGYEMLQLRTKASFDTIKEFYQGKIGKPLLFINDGDDDKSLFFQSNTTPAVFVTVEHDDDSGRWLITITRAPFQFPQPGAAKPQKQE
jgi:hypothetical protein